MKFANGILLDQKFLYRSEHGAFVNTKWDETWSERTLFVDPSTTSRVLACLSRMQGQPCNCRYTRHTATGQDTLAVPFSLVFFLLSQVGGWTRPRPAARALTRLSAASLSRPVAATRRILRWSQRFPFIRLCLVIFCFV